MSCSSFLKHVMNKFSGRSEVDNNCLNNNVALKELIDQQNSNDYQLNDYITSGQKDEFLQSQMETQPQYQESQLEFESTNDKLFSQYQSSSFAKKGLKLVDQLEELPLSENENQETNFTNNLESNLEIEQNTNDFLSEKQTQEQQVYSEEPVFNQFNSLQLNDQVKVEEDFNYYYQQPQQEQLVKDNLPSKQNKKIKKQSKKQYKYDTKNVLRNFGAAQTNFIKHHKEAFNHIKQRYCHLSNEERSQQIKEFYAWCPERPVTFPQYQKLWSSQGEFYEVYRAVCRLFYSQFAVTHIYNNSKVSDEMKQNHCKYIPRLLEGIEDPAEFNYLKNH